VRFAYKIWSRYNGFTPDEIPVRMERGKVLRLGWSRYIDQVEKGTEVWIHFFGPDEFVDGVYVYGTVRDVDLDGYEITLKVDEFSTTKPLTEPPISEAVSAIVAARGRQVFVLPEDLLRVFTCDINATAESCAKRRCGQCDAWRKLRPVSVRSLSLPPRLHRAEIAGFAPAYWAVARRSWGWNHKPDLLDGVQLTGDVFSRFKGGEEALAYPLAKGIVAALRKRGLDEADYLLPIPLSPEKAERKELHRTLALANEVSQLLGIPVRETLQLHREISKRALGVGAQEFERRYAEALSCSGIRPNPKRVIVIDDVCTKGSTLAVATHAIHGRYPECEVALATAAQMTIAEAIADEGVLLRR
jgi:hypothetical protein